MDVVHTFGQLIMSQVDEHPRRAGRIMYAGWRAQLANLALVGERRLPPSRRYASRVAMSKITQALRHPENAAATSLFTPYEPLQVAGVLPYSVEQLSSFIGGSQAERAFLDKASDAGFSETMCSYHRVYLGAAAAGMLPKPAFVVYTTLACDGNLITFPAIQRHFDVPGFCIDVPFDRSQDAVASVARQLRQMVEFVQDCTHRTITHEALCDTVARSWRSALAYRRFLQASPGKRLPSDMTTEMYAVLMNHLVSGSPETERFCQMLESDMRDAPESSGLRLVWMHTMPFSQQPLIDRVNFNDECFICASDMAADPMLVDVDPSQPYEAMARRLVYSCFNGEGENRVQRALELTRMTQADGVVLYNHWGCKATLGVSHLIKRRLEEEGVPCLLLDGDGIDVANRSDGQTSTRFDAFLELLEGRRA